MIFYPPGSCMIVGVVFVFVVLRAAITNDEVS